MATEEYSIRVSVDSTDATRAERNLNNLTSSVTQTERALNSTSSAARSSAAALAGIGRSSAGIHSMTAAMSSFARSTAQASSNTQAMSRDVTTLSATTSRSAESMRSLSNAIGLIGLGRFAKDILQTNIEMENLRARLDATFGSMAKGQQAFEDILKIAKETPQSVEEISKSFVMLKNFGIEPTIKVMQDLTNMTSKVGGNADTLSGIVRGLGQAYAKGKLQAEEANQMIERGVPVYALLSKELHKTTAEIMDMMASGEITRPVIEKLISAMGSSSVGASTKMMETLGGKISMLGDSWHQFENALLGDQSEGLIKRIVDGWMVILDGFTSRMNQSVSAQIVDLKAKLNDAENRKSFLSKGMQSLGLIDSPDQIKNQIAVLQQKRLSDFQANRQYDQSLKQEKATQAEADAIAKKTKANEEFTKKFGTAAQREKQEIDDLKKSMGELTKEQLAQVHAKYFSTTESKAHASALKEIKKEQTEYQRLIESTPYGAYNTTIDKLTEGLKRGGEAFRATYATGIEEANKKLLDSTEYVKEHTKALEEQKRALEGTARGTFEKGYSELMTQKPYMSDTEYSAKQDKLTADYLTQQQGKDYKTPAEQAKDATSAYDDLNKKLQETATAFDSVGNSSKMAFDGLLGGVSAVAGAMSSFSGEMAQLNDNFQKGSAAYSDFMLKEGTTFEQREKATADYYSMKDKYDSASFKTEISGARQIAGATSKLFGEKSAARKAFHGVEMALSVVEMAMSAKKMIVDVAAGAARMFSQGGFAGFAGVAAMAAVMGGLGFAMMGGGDKVTDLTTPETSTTGSVLGSDGASNSIKNITDTLNSIHASEYVELQGINSNFQNLTKLTTTSLALSLRDRGAFSYSADAYKGAGTSTMAMVTGALVGGVIGLLGAMFLGVGSIKYEAVGGGIVMKAQKLMLDGMEKQIEVMDYTKIKKTVTGWFSDSVTYFDVITGIDNPLTKLFRQVFSNVGTTLVQAATDSFKDTSLFNTDLTLPRMKLSLKAGEKNNADNQKKIEDAINKASDDIASQAFGRYLAQFQQMGEGLYETTIRLAAQASVATAGMEKLGSKTSLTGLGLISFSDSLTRAFGGLKEFKAGLDSLYDAFTSDPQKLIDSKKQVADFLVSLKAPVSAGLLTEITSKSDAAKVTDYLLTAAKNISAVTAPFLKTTNVKPDDIEAKTLFNRLISSDINRDAKTALKNAGVENITTTVLSEALKLSKWSIAGENDMKPIHKLYTPLIEYAKSNANYLDSKKQLNELKTDKVLNEELKKLGYAMPKTVEQAAALAEKLKALEDKATGNVAKFEGLSKATLNVITSLEKLSDAGKFITDFSKSISAWIKNIRATSMGSPETQLNMAKANFEEQLKLAKFGATAEEKRAAMSGITGYADTYMNAIKSYYATSEQGQKALEGIISQVGDLGQSIDVQELQLGALNDIKDGIYEIPKGISDANKELFNGLVSELKTAGDVAKLNPTVENQLRYDALAKIVLMIDKSAKSGADATFIDKLIQSVAGENGLTSNVNLVINSAEFDSAQKTAIIGNVLASFNEKRLVLNNFEFDVKDAINTAKASVMAAWGTPVLDINTSEVVRKLDETTSKATAAVAALGAVTASNQQSTESANAAAAAAANQSTEVLKLSQAQMDSLSKQTALPKSAENAKYWQQQSNLDLINTVMLPKFANGGIANQPSMFGEAGAEAAVPLPDGRSIPVTLYNASNDSNVNSAETIAELKSQNQKLEILVNTMMATSKAEREKTQELIDAMNGLRTDTRLKAKG
jgi:tape measure domain-containing protein